MASNFEWLGSNNGKFNLPVLIYNFLIFNYQFYGIYLPILGYLIINFGLFNYQFLELRIPILANSFTNLGQFNHQFWVIWISIWIPIYFVNSPTNLRWIWKSILRRSNANFNQFEYQIDTKFWSTKLNTNFREIQTPNFGQPNANQFENQFPRNFHTKFGQFNYQFRVNSNVNFETFKYQFQNQSEHQFWTNFGPNFQAWIQSAKSKQPKPMNGPMVNW